MLKLHYIYSTTDVDPSIDMKLTKWRLSSVSDGTADVVDVVYVNM
jgi:hypothetical protein